MEVSKSVKPLLTILLTLILTGCLDENSAPVAADDSTILNQGRSTTIDVLQNDRDKDHDPLVVVAGKPPSHGTLIIQDGGLIVYQHDGSTAGSDSFTYLTYDGAAYSAPAQVQVTILVPPYSTADNTTAPSTNQPPVAVDDQATVTTGGAVSLDLLINDSDAENDPLSIETLGTPRNGEVTLESDGTVTYRHDGSNTTADSFSYIISDGDALSASADVFITITLVNQPPGFTRQGNDIHLPIDTRYELSVEAVDPDGDELSYSVSHLPHWLHFSADTHTLSGLPSWADLGNSYPVTITVNDDEVSIENRFVITVVERWPVTDSMAHRLLVQATYGPTLNEIERVKQLGVAGWIDHQLSMRSAYTDSGDGWPSHLQRTREIALQAEPANNWLATGIFNESTGDGSVLDYQMAAWWENALGSPSIPGNETGSDQLRQRVAYALSQLLVTSDSVPVLKSRGEALAAYYDLLAEHAFGNYRTLLGEIARSPAMGIYLSHQGNSKSNPATGSRPDENFAREVIQLFSIGLYELNLDGSPNRDGNSSSYPDPGHNLAATYTQNDIEELAKVMTGWDLASNSRFGRVSSRDGDYANPMVFHPEQHENESATGGDGYVTVLGQTFSLNSGNDQSGLDSGLDVLFSHPNVAPYVSRHLIQRLVTSNPSPAYLARVAQVFNNNGNGVKGDLKAVVRAILLDPEARDDRYLIDPSYGKAKEPLLAITQLLRAVHSSPLNGWNSQSGVAMNGVYWFRAPQAILGQGPLRSPSVFNFYSPGHIPRDNRFIVHNLVAPELQIQTDQMLIEYSNLVFSLLNSFEKNHIIHFTGETLAAFGASFNSHSEKILLTNFDTEISLFEQALEGDNDRDFASINDTSTDIEGDTPKANAIDALLDHLDLLLLGGHMSPEIRSALKHYLVTSAGTNHNRPFMEARSVIRDAIAMIVTSSSYMIQK
ncbi:MAG: DUF1800 family protein [Candidatus Thiodiazotropha sp. (ex Lucina aurantia)]|nr:DUF1800 family protein [Candidatus Thiodiazotropha sp. (ex Lucina pensylvanica)]MBT3023422.1 DUF1800 family protein [Candidatus Thiodiazotropha taylori]MBV2100583.1 DUF1800 family protein [Candidatus Thiodiazotropha sp. (ex Codakia orbicularis)]MBV2103199.1 DUF1800 family protein [Candidatus Thiodiazotropha sp. (ex Lucina aurantia)]MBV2117634.1 DUF1800 family protein [Candidatus Thiodiazotropha sp. (ex Lucina aurantia)]